MNRPAAIPARLNFFPSVARDEDENIRWKLFQRFAEIQNDMRWRRRYFDVDKEQSSQTLMIITQCRVRY